MLNEGRFTQLSGIALTNAEVAAVNKLLYVREIPSPVAQFAGQADVIDKQKSLGSEIDLQMNWKVMKDVTFQCGYSMMFATRAMEWKSGSKVGNHNSWQDWGWVSLNINPRLFAFRK